MPVCYVRLVCVCVCGSLHSTPGAVAPVAASLCQLSSMQLRWLSNLAGRTRASVPSLVVCLLAQTHARTFDTKRLLAMHAFACHKPTLAPFSLSVPHHHHLCSCLVCCDRHFGAILVLHWALSHSTTFALSSSLTTHLAKYIMI